MILSLVLGLPLLGVGWLAYTLFIQPLSSPLRNLPGPDSSKGFGLGGHLRTVLKAGSSKAVHEEFVAKYGKSVRIKGLGNFEDRLLSTDPVVLAYIMNHSNEFQKPWQSRRIIARLIGEGEGLLATEGDAHRRMRRVSTPAFSVQNMRALVPITFKKAFELKDKWNSMINEQSLIAGLNDESQKGSARLDVCHWINRAAFDIIGLAGFDYSFSAIQHEKNELFLAYRDMFEIVVSRGETLWDIVLVYFPWLERIFPNEKTRTVQKSQEIINRIGGQLIKEKAKRLVQGEKNDSGYGGTDILSLLIKSNLSTDTPHSQRLSDVEVLANLNTFFFAGSDTTSLTLTWVLHLLATHPSMQDRLRTELRSFSETAPNMPSLDEKQGWQEVWTALDELPYLNNVLRETLRLISPLHSSLRVAMRDDEIPTSEPIKMRDGSVRYGIKIKKGQFVHIPVDAANTDKGVWGDDAWLFNPDRWDNLPAVVLEQPGLYNHILTFSAGPRSCIGMRFSLIVMKSFLYVLLSNFAFAPSEGERVFAANVVLMRPYVTGRFLEGSQCPLLISRI